MAVHRTGTRKTLSDEVRLAKNETIKRKGIETRARRKKMDTQVFTTKIVMNTLSREKQDKLHRAFLEAKWLYNAALADNTTDQNYAKKHNYQITVLVKDKPEQREIRVLGSQMCQGVIRGLLNNMKSLAALKEKGHKIGALNYVSELNSIDLAQHEITYEVLRDRNMIRVQGIGKLRVRGLDQLPIEAEFANAKLIKKSDGYYIAITTFVNKKEAKPYNPATILSIDFNITDQFVLNNGQKFNFVVEETVFLKRLQQKLARQVKGSNNYKRTLRKIDREYQKMNGIKDNLARQFVAELLKFELIIIQDDDFHSWMRSNYTAGQVIQHSILGRVKEMLKQHDRVIVLNRYAPTTSYCAECKRRTKHKTSQRTFECRYCGFVADRDVHAAENMIEFVFSGQYVDKNEFKRLRNRAAYGVMEVGTSGSKHFSVCGDKYWSVKHVTDQSSGLVVG